MELVVRLNDKCGVTSSRERRGYPRPDTNVATAQNHSCVARLKSSSS